MPHALLPWHALQIEKAGGYSSCDGLLVSGLDVPIESHDQRTQICYGSKAEVQRFEEYVYGNSPRFAEVRARSRLDLALPVACLRCWSWPTWPWLTLGTFDVGTC